MIHSAGQIARGVLVFLTVCMLPAVLSAHSSEISDPPARHYPSLPMHTDFGGPFQLTDHKGNAFSQDDLKGHYSLLYFGYTNCPDICSIALYTIEVALDEIGAPDGLVIPYLINLDPQRKSLPDLSEYIGFFHKDLVGLTGTDKQIRVITGAYSVRYKHVGAKDNDRKTVHSGMIFLLDPTGEAVAMLPHDVPQDWLTGTLREHIFEHSAADGTSPLTAAAGQ
jgi:protein SCO1/2